MAVTNATLQKRKAKRRTRSFAKHMRHRATDAESRFWYGMRNRRIENCKFRRQFLIGPYIVDFVCLEQRLVVEIDGGQHAENPRDNARDAYMTAQGFRVLRFWNNDVLTNMDGVVLSILQVLEKQPPHPPLRGGLSPNGGEAK